MGFFLVDWLVSLFQYLVSLFHENSKSATPQNEIIEEQNEPQMDNPRGNLQQRRGRGALDRMRQRAQQQQQLEQQHAGSDEDNSEDSDNSEDNDNEPQMGKMSKKAMEKMRKKEEKKQAKQYEAQLREEREQRKQEREEEERRAQLQRQEEKALQEEEERKIKEEKEKKEEEEYQKWKQFMQIEKTGTVDEADSAESQEMLTKFVEYVKDHKVVVLEDLAAEFKLRTDDAVKRVTELEASGRLSGVFDERGKFIFISEKELDQVARFVKQRGRVSITELAAESNKLINLNPEVPTQG